jgi:PEP-CTERM motif
MSLLNKVPPRVCGWAAAAVLSTLVAAPAVADPITVLFVGNSFTYGDAAGGPNIVQPYQANTVNDLNHQGIGGVPALFKQMTVEKGLNYSVSLETHPGVGLDWHWNNELSTITGNYNQVVLQSYSTLDGAHPGNPATLIQYSGMLANLYTGINPNTQVFLDSTWSRADQTYQVTNSPWYGKGIYAMETDVRAGYNAAAAANANIDGVIQTGDAWARAMMNGYADTNPYDGIDPGKVDLWAPEGYHASVYGYYLEALMFFGELTGLDPELLGWDQVAMDLGLTSEQAILEQHFAALALGVIPEPESFALIGLGLVGLAFARRRRAQR